VTYTLPRPDRTGRTAIQLSPIELLQRLARLIPPPRVHRHRYHGVFAPNSRWRREVTRYGRESEADLDDQPDAGLDTDSGQEPAIGACAHLGRSRGARRRWAQLLARVYEIDPLSCPACDGPMRILAFLTDPTVVRPILRHLSIPQHPPPLSPARAPPQTELLAVDPPSAWDRETTGSLRRDPFDQSLPGDDGTWSA